MIGSVTLNLYWMLFGLTLTVLGLESFLFGCLAQSFCDYGDASRRKWMRRISLHPSSADQLGLDAASVSPWYRLAIHYVTHSFRLPNSLSVLDHLAVTGILLFIVGFSIFGFTLLLHATGVRYGRFVRVECRS